MNRREFLRYGAIAGAAGAASLGAYTIGVEPHWERVIDVDMPIVALPARLVGARLVQISDLHVGPQVDAGYLVRALRQVAALAPDILVVTGDFITAGAEDQDGQLMALRDVLSQLPHGRLGTFGVLGNHDYGRGWSNRNAAGQVTREAERAGIRILGNETASVDGLDIVGVGDLWARAADPERALRGRTADAALALCHNPDALDELPWGDFRGWVLSGHTHGGQCMPPFLPPPILPVKNKRYSAGEVAIADGRRLYINRGLGYTLRARFNVRPEITHFTLREGRIS